MAAAGTVRSASASATATKKPATAAEAPIWKNYLAVRTGVGVSDSANWRLQLHGGALTQARSRKRSKPSNIYSGTGGSHANWMVVPSQARSRFADENSSVAPRIRKYWEQLSANERQQILFIDEPDLVKQLYKLNLSLLCVGLMQRHLKTPLKQTTVVKSVTTSQPIAAAAATPSSAQPETIEGAAATEKSTALETNPPPATAAVADAQAEKTYELLEAMEFMDLGTGILTVKSELVEDTDRLFTLVGDVLFGFVTSIHVLGEKQFYDLFVTESEVINSWEDYQRLIAMLVEQLIIKSYVNHLEKEAANQMEELLLEVSLEDSKPTRKDHTTSKDPTQVSPSNLKSKKKKKKKKKDDASSARRDDSRAKDQPEPEDFEDDEEHGQQMNDENDPDASNSTTASSNMDIDETMMADEDFTFDEAEDAAPSLREDSSSPTKPSISAIESKEQRASSSLNPNASVFQPQQEVLPPKLLSPSPSVVGKRKLDKYIVNVQFQDAISDDEYYRGGDCELDSSSDDGFGDDPIPPQSQERRREEDAELAWQLQQMYASTSTMLGWDFNRQCEVVVHPGLVLPWDESVLWRTAPKEVVRYFTPGAESGNGFGPFFHPPGGVPYPFAPPYAGGVSGVGGGSSSQLNSRYYFVPPLAASAMPLSTTFIPSGGGPHPRMLPPPPQGGTVAGASLPHHHQCQPRMFAFQEANFRGVVTSPDFSATKPELLRRKKGHEDPE